MMRKFKKVGFLVGLQGVSKNPIPIYLGFHVFTFREFAIAARNTNSV
jgi:hypothetical protein